MAKATKTTTEVAVEETEEAAEATFTPTSRVLEDGRAVHLDRDGCVVVIQAAAPPAPKGEYPPMELVRERMQTHHSVQAPPPADLRGSRTFGVK
ncbi:hypothetical protein [Bradyrhizobium archetypum]|uniref:Uncharacterized protein n=1 Tax=Bradyrhizobium archetypum TaxID=2721160 RepID=A0A7Y4H685_9BRAD|nr:hypothetical protein [Bradyrhizobium archetypum]NOJ48426.1 hypothetical protein [Bradyrhizobium archetypum]